MQIVININNDDYEEICNKNYMDNWIEPKNTYLILNAIKDGISLERVLGDIKTEVTNIKDYRVVDGGLYVREFDVVEIIYKYIKEKGKK